MSKLLVVRYIALFPFAQVPTVNHIGEDLGFDLYAAESVTLLPGVATLVHTGISAAYVDSRAYTLWRRLTFRKPRRFGFTIGDRSGLASKGVQHSAGIIDAGYTGEIGVILTWFPTPGTADQMVFRIGVGDRIAQLMPKRVRTAVAEEVDQLPKSDRGGKGWGSSGR